MPTEKNSIPAKELEEQWGVQLPTRLRKFFDEDEWQTYEGRLVCDLAHFGSDTKTAVSFFDRDYLPGKFEYSEGFQKSGEQSLMPLCEMPEMDGTFFMAIDLAAKDLPVLFFDYEEGFHDHSASFDEFLAGLLQPGEKTRAEQLQELTDQAKALYDKEQYAEARDLLEEGYGRLADVKFDIFDHLSHLPGAARNLLGLCYKALGDLDRALAVFENAIETDRDKSAALNVLSIYLNDRKDYRRVIEYGTRIGREMLFNFYDYHAFYQRLYIGRAHIQLGEANEAATQFGMILARFVEKDIAKIRTGVEDLKEIQDAGGEAGAIAENILDWFGPPPVRLDEATIVANRAWWDALPKSELRSEFAKLMELPKKKQPTDEDLGRLLRRTSLKIQHSAVKDLAWLERFPRLRTLNLEGNEIRDLNPLEQLKALVDLDLANNPVENLEPLSQLTRLTDLDLSETGIQDLAPLQNLRELRKLRAKGNEIESLEGLRGLPELREVTVYSNRIRDLEPLGESPLLKEISCFDNPLEEPEAERGHAGVLAIRSLPLLEEMDAHIEDISSEDLDAWREARPWTVELSDAEYQDWLAWWRGLDDRLREALLEEVDDDEIEDGVPTAEGFFELRKEDYLRLSDKGLSDVAGLTRLNRLDHLTLGKNGLSALPDLSALRCLRTLDLNDNTIHQLAGFAKLPVLAALDLAGNEIESLSDFPAMPSLRKLELERNRIVDLSALSAQSGLRKLYLEKNRIRDVSPLASLKDLRLLWLQENAITDFAPLAACTNLEELVCSANPGASGLLALKDLPYLYLVKAYGVFAADEVAEFRRLRPDVDLL